MNKPSAKRAAMSDIASHLGKSNQTITSASFGAVYFDWYSFGITHMSLDFSIDMTFAYRMRY